MANRRAHGIIFSLQRGTTEGRRGRGRGQRKRQTPKEVVTPLHIFALCYPFMKLPRLGLPFRALVPRLHSFLNRTRFFVNSKIRPAASRLLLMHRASVMPWRSHQIRLGSVTSDMISTIVSRPLLAGRGSTTPSAGAKTSAHAAHAAVLRSLSLTLTLPCLESQRLHGSAGCLEGSLACHLPSVRLPTLAKSIFEDVTCGPCL
jgi:hypothetical protein